MKKQNGYVMDSIYPSYFYKDTQPLWLSTVARLRGVRGPDLDRPYRYCELGCGAGFNAILVAALNPGAQVVGVDFNRAHIELAQALARDMGVANVSFACLDFQGFCKDNGAPFDIIDCHGVWSWVAPTSQRSILEIVARHLAPRGLFCLHYMCHPGSTPMIPVQQLVRSVAQQAGAGSREALGAGLAALEHLLAAGHYDDQPPLRERLRGMRAAGVDNLAHDLLSDFWSVHHAGDMHWLATQAGLSFIGASDMFYNLDPAICLPPDMHAMPGIKRSPALVETLKDMASGRPHRSDVFQKNAVAPDSRQRRAALNTLAFMRNPGKTGTDLGCPTVSTPLGSMDLSDPVFAHIAGIANANATFGFTELCSPEQPDSAAKRVVEALTLMLHAELILPAQAARSKADAAAIAAINRLLQARQVRLRLDRDAATAWFVP